MKFIKRTRRTKSEGLLAFFICPIVFFLIGIFIMYITLKPVINPITKFSNIMLLSQKPTFKPIKEEMFKISETDNLNNSSESLDISPDQMPTTGRLYGHIKTGDKSIDAPIYFGDSDIELLQGVGTYAEGYLPGAGKTILMTAHSNLFFYNLDNVKVGDIIYIDTNYGKYQYQIYDTKIAKNTDSETYDLNSDTENLILYTCYPLDKIGITDERYFVYAKYIQGPRLSLIY